MELHLHLTVLIHEVRRETLYISFVYVRRVEYPLTAHLVLDVLMLQQFVEADGREAVVLCYLGDGDGLRAAQDGACLVGQRFLIGADVLLVGIADFECTVLFFHLEYLLLQFVASVLADGRKHFAGYPSLESSCAFQLRRKDECVES